MKRAGRHGTIVHGGEILLAGYIQGKLAAFQCCIQSANSFEGSIDLSQFWIFRQ